MNKTNEDQVALEVIARLNGRTHLEQIDVDGRSLIISHKGYTSRHLFEIENFVLDIEKGCNGGFVDEVTRSGRVRKILELPLGKKYYRLINTWIERYSDEYCYSARIEVFYDVCKELNLISQDPFPFGAPDELDCIDGMRYMDVFNLLIEQIRARCQSREFKERERLRKLNAKRNMRKVLALDKAMFSKEMGRSRWLILSLTLAYKPEYRDSITPEIIQEHRDRFFAARSFNKLMSGIRNFVWKIEQGEETGLHLHVILFYSSNHNHDEFISRQIGEYWIDTVTKGKGRYWNGNAGERKLFYKKHGHGVGVGQINRNDTEKREALRENLVYLAKAEQYLRVKTAERFRTFYIGPVPEKVKSGRPRADFGTPKHLFEL